MLYASFFGSYLVENVKGMYLFLLYFNQVFNALEFGDLIPATIKASFLAFAIGLVGCFKGYYCKKGTAGVGVAANSAVVYTSMLIIDFIAVLLLIYFMIYNYEYQYQEKSIIEIKDLKKAMEETIMF
jgi:phospholipid/cholesterol/gamma-HCH transport system permease protein